MARLLVVHHSPSDGLRRLVDAVLSGAAADGIVGVEVVAVDALGATADDVARADGYLLGTPANLGYISGALKHFFDVVYNPSLGVTRGRPYGAWIHGESDTTGAALALEKITTGLEWRAAQPVLEMIGPVDDGMVEQAWELGAAVAAGLMAE
ncbi:MAG: NAD(P)H-dependent oxidoreductase [Acidimicrobiales bacterium]